jgi:threonine dehydratase
VPVGGGGLISGIALAVKSMGRAVRVVGVSMERAPVMYHSLKAGKPIRMEQEESLADALLGGIGLDNQCTFGLVQEYVDDFLLVSEKEIAQGVAFALERHHLVVEGSGAVGMAALLGGKVNEPGDHVAVVISGGNIDMPLLLELGQGYTGQSGSGALRAGSGRGAPGLTARG